MSDVSMYDDSGYSMLPSHSEDEFTVPNTAGVGIVPTPSINSDNINDGEPFTLQTLTGSVSGGLDSLQSILEQIGAVKTAVDEIRGNGTNAAVTAPVQNPVDPRAIALLAIAGAIIAVLVVKG